MENRTEFNLEYTLKHWTLNLKKSLQFTESNLLELESHMLDEIERLQALGLTDEEAFVLAKHQMGADDELISEFGKVNHKLHFVNRISPYIKGMLLYIFFVTFAQDMFMNFGMGLQYFNIEGNSAIIIFSSFLLVFATVLTKSVNVLYKNPASKLKHLATFRNVFILGLVSIGATKSLNLYLTNLNIETYNLVYTHQDLFIPHAIFLGSFHVLLIAIAIWSYRVKKKENRIQLSS